MKRKLQVSISEEAWKAVENLQKEANQDFKSGNISFADTLNEMLLATKVDLKVLQAKCTNLRKSLRNMASEEDMDLDKAIKLLIDLKSKGIKRTQKAQATQEELI